MFTFSDKAFQDGIQCERGFMVNDFTSKSDTNIQPGKTFTCEAAYTLNDTTTPVDIEVSELISFSGKKIVKTFNLQ